MDKTGENFTWMWGLGGAPQQNKNIWSLLSTLIKGIKGKRVKGHKNILPLVGEKFKEL